MKHAIIALVNLSSAGRDPVFLLSPEEYPTLRKKLTGSPLSQRRTLTLGSVTLINIGGVPELPERIMIHRQAVCVADGSGERCFDDRGSLFSWIVKLTEEAGYADHARLLRSYAVGPP